MPTRNSHQFYCKIFTYCDPNPEAILLVPILGFPKADATLMLEKPATMLLEFARLDAKLLGILDMFTILLPSI
jgi:hypothetical protein